MRASLRLRALAVAAVLLGGCVTTRIRVDEPDARVYVDGRRVAPGQRFWAVGPPHRADVRVVSPDGREARVQMKRGFGFGTLLLGFYSMGVCWAVCWSYPDELTVHLPPRPASSWDAAPADDPWTRPPPGWSPPAPSAPRPAADPWSAPPADRP